MDSNPKPYHSFCSYRRWRMNESRSRREPPHIPLGTNFIEVFMIGLIEIVCVDLVES